LPEQEEKMEKNIKQAVTLASELADIFNILVRETQDLDLQRLFKQLEADIMDMRHKLSLAIKIINSTMG
jgi:uncharacterized protein YutE (UPF0331/DUF86 family)